jgi:regulator of protease activity HflC (stomatin/prohibitin superfamily)
VDDPIEELRANADAVPPAPEAMAGYLAKVRDRAYTVTDADVPDLDEDVVFEQTVAAAIREGLRRLDRAREVLG